MCVHTGQHADDLIPKLNPYLHLTDQHTKSHAGTIPASWVTNGGLQSGADEGPLSLFLCNNQLTGELHA